MAEYIERETIKEKMIHYGFKSPDMTVTEFVEDELPAADVAPVRHGQWIEKEKYNFGIMYDCSLCENRILDNGHSWNYCPNCGARMTEDIDEQKK